MTERKPIGMTFDGWVERQIQEARERGAFDDLPHRGQPLPGIDGRYDENWWAREYLRRENVSYLPPALQLKVDVERALDEIERAPSATAVRETVAKINERIREVRRSPGDGPRSAMAALDADELVRRWEASRSASDAPDPREPLPRPPVGNQERVAFLVLGVLAVFIGGLAWGVLSH